MGIIASPISLIVLWQGGDGINTGHPVTLKFHYFFSINVL